jgi:hypothetical protein
MASTVVRQDARFKVPARSAVSIPEALFGAPAGTGGPRWILDPPPAIQELFWRRFGDVIDGSSDVFAVLGRVLLTEVRDAHERPLPALADRSGEAWLFFIDRVPEANWSHACAYAVLPVEGEPLLVEHVWPPSESIELARIRRPAAAR